MIITISGMPGSGKSTVAKLIQKELDIPRVYGGQLIRDKAKENNMDLLTYLNHMAMHPEEEKKIDQILIQQTLKHKDVILESRVAHHFLPNALSVFLDVTPKEGSQRIFKDMQTNKQRNETPYTNIQEAQAAFEKRVEQDQERYKELYDIDIFDSQAYVLIIDTTKKTPQQVADTIIKKYKEVSNNLK